MTQPFPRLSSPLSEIGDLYDVVVVGSGYGGSIAASRCARAGQRVCLLERGKEWRPGDFPEKFTDAAGMTQITRQGAKGVLGDPTNLFDFNISQDITVLQGCGLGGGSLINASVGLEVDNRVLEQPEWPKEIREDLVNLVEVDKPHVEEMLRPRVYPDSYPPLAKMAAMREAAKQTRKFAGDADIEDTLFIKTPLYVNFDTTKTNHVGIDQPACNGCGNCVTGCNTGAKNTLNMNYIPDAVAHGAKVFTQVEVTAVVRDSFSSLWCVHYARKIPTGGFELHEHKIRAKYVILAAGALGSTKILLKSRARGLDVSNQLGHRFTGNGDVIGYCYNAKKELNGVGMKSGMYDKVHLGSPGPTITSALDLRRIQGEELKEGLIMEDGTSPSLLETPYAVTMAIASGLIGVKKANSDKARKKLYRKHKGKDINGTLAFLGMSFDDANGRVLLDSKTDHACIEWPGVGRQQTFEKVNSQMAHLAHSAGGTFVQNPMWTRLMGKELVSAHPLGGCPAGETGKKGVVNHRGQVFIGDSSDVYPDLLVMDGAIMPTSLGVNPSFTISLMAERCCRLLAEEAGWELDYRLDKHLDTKAFAETKPGLRFTERMSGTLTMTDDDGGPPRESPCEFTVTIESQDLDQMLHHDINHSASLTGTVTCSALSAQPMQVEQGGRFELFKQSRDIVGVKEMSYFMKLVSDEGRSFLFRGTKIIKKDHFGETGLRDTTTLFVKILTSHDDEKPLATGVLKIHIKDFIHQISTMEILNVRSGLRQLQWKAKLSGFFGQVLWETYSGLHCRTPYDPSAPPRQKRRLSLGNAVPEVFPITTEDKVDLKLTRYQGGGKGPILLSHGMAMSAQSFALDTVPENLVEFLVRHHFDVWLFDWRGSIDLPWVCNEQYTIDDVGRFDFPAAVDKVLEVTGEQDLQVLVHCVASLAFFASLLRGHLRGKIRSVIASQVSATPVGTFYNKLKSSFHIPGFIRSTTQVKSITAYTDIKAGKLGGLFNRFSNVVARAVTKADQKCFSDICHRLTTVYGLLYEHENLNRDTHNVLHEMFGSGSVSLFQHLGMLFRKQRLVTANGQDNYLPNLNDKHRLQNSQYVNSIANLNIPICFFRGENNSVFDVQSQLRTKTLAKESFHDQHYEMLEIKGYGHLDTLIGKHAAVDVFPKLLSFLDKYAQDNAVKNQLVISEVEQVMITLKAHHQRKQGVRKPGNIPLDYEDNKAPEFLKLSTDARNKIRLPLLCLNDDRDNPLTSEPVMVWKRKNFGSSLFQKEACYIPPEKNAHQDVLIEEISIPDSTLKREIIVISGLLLGGNWGRNIEGRMREFCEGLSETASQFCHTLVLLGDILDLWHVPISTSPPSPSERLSIWRKDKTITYFADFIREISSTVRVFYLTGNHDHAITEKEVHTLFGSQVKYVHGTLVYVINNGDATYRIRLEHGHDFDLINSYSVLPDDFPGDGCPIGYYVTRSVVSSVESDMNDCEKVMEDVFSFFLSSISSSLFGSAIIDLLSNPNLGQRMNELLLERALDRAISPDDKVMVDDREGTVLLTSLVKYPLLQEVAKKVGATRTFSMLRASLGDWNDFLYECHEDVVVLGHSHKWENQRMKGRGRPLYYVNSGTFIDYARHMSYAKLSPPTKTRDGSLEVCCQAKTLSPSQKQGS